MAIIPYGAAQEGTGFFAPNPYAQSSMHALGLDPNYQLAEAERGRLAGQKQAETAVQPALQANQMRQERFNTIFPWLQNQIGSFGSNMATAGGASPKSPEITVGGVFNPQQIQQQVNATRATNDRAMQSQNAQQTNKLAGQGFGANSPLLAALQGQNFAANLGTNTQAEQQLRTTAAQQNAQQVLGTQQARETQFANRQREDIERRKPYFGLYGQMLSSLGGLV